MGFPKLNEVRQIPFPNPIFIWNQSKISQHQMNVKIGKFMLNITLRKISNTSFSVKFFLKNQPRWNSTEPSKIGRTKNTSTPLQ